LLLCFAHDLIQVHNIETILGELVTSGRKLLLRSERREECQRLFAALLVLFLVFFDLTPHQGEQGLLLHIVLNLAFKDLDVGSLLVDPGFVHLVFELHAWQELLRRNLKVLKLQSQPVMSLNLGENTKLIVEPDVLETRHKLSQLLLIRALTNDEAVNQLEREETTINVPALI
jgi:hypothetical protein